MADPDTIRATITRYMAAMSAGDRATWVDCFADGGTLEDPVGADVLSGPEDLGAFFDNAHAMSESIIMEPTGPVRIAAGQAAFPFLIITVVGGEPLALPVIDVMTFDDDGRITSMRAFWDMADLAPHDA